jgi:pantoate--beta-alanine ligase
VSTRADLAAARDAVRGAVGLVPTMGALHAGHGALIETANAECDVVVVSIFVNPLQFGPNEDLARYPRTLDADLQLCERLGTDIVWAPTVTDMYPHGGAQVQVSPGPLGAILEGVSRPTHFAGMLTVVAKLLNTVRPARGYFGEKDYQQLTLIRQMAADLDLGAGIVGVPTVREADGLAMSSRNRYLSAVERIRARALSRALFAGRDAAAAGGLQAGLTVATGVLAAEPGIDVDYLELCAPDLAPAPDSGIARLLVAARVGQTRLIDNIEVSG